MFQALGSVFHTVFIVPVLNILVIIYSGFASIGLPGAFGFAIISITVAVRLLMHPLFQKQMHAAKVMKDLKPHIDALQKKHKKDPQMLQKEQMRLYQEAGINPASGCLFAIVQIPIIFGLYQALQLFFHFDKNGNVSKIKEINRDLYLKSLQVQSIDTNFFFFNLAISPAAAGLWYYYLVPVITAGLQYWQSVVTMSNNPMVDASPEPVVEKETKLKTDKPKKDEKKNSNSDDFQKAMNTQMKYFFPIMIGYFSYTLPLGLSLYWNAFSLFSIIAHYLTHKKIKN